MSKAELLRLQMLPLLGIDLKMHVKMRADDVFVVRVRSVFFTPTHSRFLSVSVLFACDWIIQFLSISSSDSSCQMEASAASIGTVRVMCHRIQPSSPDQLPQMCLRRMMVRERQRECVREVEVSVSVSPSPFLSLSLSVSLSLSHTLWRTGRACAVPPSGPRLQISTQSRYGRTHYRELLTLKSACCTIRKKKVNKQETRNE
jgi:hypothetical protein